MVTFAHFDMKWRAKDAGDEEAMFCDADYIKALDYALPSTAGERIGTDRLAMLFASSPTIRDVILFPQLRKEQLSYTRAIFGSGASKTQ